MIMKSNYQSTPCDNTVNTVQYWLSNWALQLTRFCILQLIHKENRTNGFSKPNRTDPNLKIPFRTSLLGIAVDVVLLTVNATVGLIGQRRSVVHWVNVDNTDVCACVWIVLMLMQNACIKYSSFLQRLVTTDLLTLSQLQTSFHNLIDRLQDMKQVCSFILMMVVSIGLVIICGDVAKQRYR